MSVQYLGQTETDNLFVVYLKFTFNSVSCILSGNLNQITLWMKKRLMTQTSDVCRDLASAWQTPVSSKKGRQSRHGSQGVRLATASHGHKGAAKKALANILGSEAEKIGLSRVRLLRS